MISVKDVKLAIRDNRLVLTIPGVEERIIGGLELVSVMDDELTIRCRDVELRSLQERETLGSLMVRQSSLPQEIKDVFT